MKVKYQVFVSSTYEDLKKEREQVIKAVLEMGHIPVGMEMFSAADEEQWELIKRTIDDCDYYVVVAAHRYGSTAGGISYTEKEYDYSISKSVPTLGFVISDEAKWEKSKMDTDPSKQDALTRFKDKLKKKPVNEWGSTQDLYGKVSIALSKAITAYPRPGWIRATGAASPEVTTELSRLSRENAELRDQEEERRITLILNGNKVQSALYFEGDTDWTSDAINTSLYTIFELLAPHLMVERTLKSSAIYLGVLLNPKGQKEHPVRAEWPIPLNILNNWLCDLQVLGLTVSALNKRSTKIDETQCWVITDKGKAVYSMMRIASLEATLHKVP